MKKYAQMLWNFLSGFHLAVISMVVLIILTFFCTIDQTERGLYLSLQSYFDWKAVIVQPEWNGKKLPLILPGGYWVCAVFTLNLICGGIVRMRKGWKNVGVLISHFSMVFLMIGGAITHHESQHTLVSVNLNSKTNAGQGQDEYVIEVMEIVDGDSLEPVVINNDLIKPLLRFKGGDKKALTWVSMDERTFDIKEMGISVKLTDWCRNSQITDVRKTPNTAEDGKVVDGRYLRWRRAFTETELGRGGNVNIAGAYITVISEEGEQELILQDLPLHEFYTTPITMNIGGRLIGFRLTREVTVLPYYVRLDHAVSERYPGTNRPKSFSSDVTRISDDGEKKFHIAMNEPMRYKGYTLFQARMGNDDKNSVFEVVHNPSDQWPLYSILIATFGLLVHFCVKLYGFIMLSSRKSAKRKAAAQEASIEGNTEEGGTV